MFEYEESPPSLHHSPSPSDQSHFTSRDTTPVTPVSATLPSRKPTRKQDRSLPWWKTPPGLGYGQLDPQPCSKNDVLIPDFDDPTFPLFGASPTDSGMATGPTPIDINVRQTSTSPRGNQPSTLTSAIQRSNGAEKTAADGMAMDSLRPIPPVPQDASNDSERLHNGARPISVKGGKGMNDRFRRESLAQSLGTGMSWGGVSVGSWIRDE